MFVVVLARFAYPLPLRGRFHVLERFEVKLYLALRKLLKKKALIFYPFISSENALIDESSLLVFFEIQIVQKLVHEFHSINRYLSADRQTAQARVRRATFA